MINVLCIWRPWWTHRDGGDVQVGALAADDDVDGAGRHELEVGALIVEVLPPVRMKLSQSVQW